MSEQTVTVWLTKWWSTRGIVRTEAIIYASPQGTQYATNEHTGLHFFLPLGRDALLTEAEAIERVRELRKKKIAALKKQIAKLEAAE